jgi:hypothetical protein
MGIPPSEAPQDDRVVRIRQHGGFSSLPDLVYQPAFACCRKELACRPATCERSELPLQAGTAGKAHQKRGEPQVRPFLRYCASKFSSGFCHELGAQTAYHCAVLPRTSSADCGKNSIFATKHCRGSPHEWLEATAAQICPPLEFIALY